MAEPTFLSGYTRAGKLLKLLPVPCVLSVVLALLLPLAGSASIILYWAILFLLARQLSSCAISWKDGELASSGRWIMLGSIAGISSSILIIIFPIDTHLVQMNAILSSTADPETVMRLLSPYITSIMANAVVAVPIQVLLPPACALAGWIKLEAHVNRIRDVQRYVVAEGVRRVIVGTKLQVGMGLCLTGTIASIWSAFTGIAMGDDMNGDAVLFWLATTGILGIGVLVTAIGSFFTLIAGYSKTGDALSLIQVDRGGTTGDGGSAATRCGTCGNSFESVPGIKYCPVCGAELD